MRLQKIVDKISFKKVFNRERYFKTIDKCFSDSNYVEFHKNGLCGIGTTNFSKHYAAWNALKGKNVLYVGHNPNYFLDECQMKFGGSRRYPSNNLCFKSGGKVEAISIHSDFYYYRGENKDLVILDESSNKEILDMAKPMVAYSKGQILSILS